jgi:Protein of unknown function (DUF1638)
MLIKIIACEVMKEELLTIVSKDPIPEIELQFVSMGLHIHPKKLHQELQELLKQSKEYSRIILGFGLCGGAANQLSAPDCRLTIPRVHDCIPLLLGSKLLYRQLSDQILGTFYLSGGWIEGEHSILNEHQRICDKFGAKKALRVLTMMFENYQRLLYINTGHPRETANLSEAQKLAQLLNLDLQIQDGNRQYLDKIINGPWDEAAFITIPPGEIVHEEYFTLA